nr:DUF512 domain-containing protein [uncultured Lachnoanaerobaculum sp.]
MNFHIIKSVAKGSIAEELEIEPGDKLISIDGNEIKDVLDYRYYINAEEFTMVIEKANGEEWELDIESDYEDIGLEFEEGLMSDYKSCTNNCIFCFIDQMPKGMRETLYFKDDDSRLSFLQGNYVTLTNMKDADIDRIIRFNLAPINISVHTTNPELRKEMLHNRFAGESLKYIDKLYEKNVPMNGQVVMCPGYNDGEELKRTLNDLLKYAPTMESVSVVPVGITKFRDDLPRLTLVDKDKAKETISIIEEIQQKAMKKCGMHFAQASDEFYLIAGRQMPSEDTYDGYIQLENGVGMLRLLSEEVRDAVETLKVPKADIKKEEIISVATAILPAHSMEELLKEIEEKFPSKKINLYVIRNDFFGERITVAGLLTGVDIINQLKGKELGDRLLLSVNMFRSGEEVLLDDLTRSDIERELDTKTVIVGQSGYDLVNAIVSDNYIEENAYKAYEKGVKNE